MGDTMSATLKDVTATEEEAKKTYDVENVQFEPTSLLDDLDEENLLRREKEVKRKLRVTRLEKDELLLASKLSDLKHGPYVTRDVDQQREPAD